MEEGDPDEDELPGEFVAEEEDDPTPRFPPGEDLESSPIPALVSEEGGCTTMAHTQDTLSLWRTVPTQRNVATAAASLNC